MIIVLINTHTQLNEMCRIVGMTKRDFAERVERHGQYAASFYKNYQYHGFCRLSYYIAEPGYKWAEIMCYKEYKRRRHDYRNS